MIVTLQLFAKTSGAQGAAETNIALGFRDEKLKTVLKQIEKASGFRLVYPSEQVNKYDNVTLVKENRSVQKTLELILNNTGLAFKQVNNSIIIFKKQINDHFSLLPTEAGYSSLFVTAQPSPQPVTGKVTDKNGNPLPGVSVLVKGTKNGVVTNTNGVFSLSGVHADDATLVISSIGFEHQEIKLNGKTDIGTIQLVPRIESLKDVEVNTGYQTINKDSYTGTAVTVSGEELKKVNPQNILRSLQAFDPSFKVVENNLAGSNPNTLPTINVRGSTALPSGSSTDIISRNNLSGTANLPTFILDGYEVSLQKIYDLDINRVKSVTLLKDAAATAVYGSRAANGVVVITTIPPKNGKLQVSYNYELNVTAPDLTDYHVLDATQKLAYEKLAGLYDAANNQAMSQDQLDEIYYHKKEQILSGVNTYWLSQPLNTTFGQKHSLYLEGGANSFRYGLEFRYQTAPGVMKGSGRDRYSTSLNLSYNMGTKFIFQNTISVTDTKSTESPYGSFSDYAAMNPYYPKTDSTGHILQVVDNWTNRSSSGAVSTTPVLNPMYNATLGSFNKTQYLELIDAFSTDWNIVNGLRLRGLISLNQTNTTGDDFVSPFANQFYFYTSSQLNQKGSYDYNSNAETSVDGSLTLTFNRQIKGHFINLVVGSNIRTYLSKYKSFSATGFTNDRFSDIGFAYSYAQGSTPYDSVGQERLFGAFTSLNYSYRDKYLMDFTVREDGSSKFGSNDRIAPFSAVGIGWNVHKESFMEGSPFSRLKIRASTGLTGSVSFDPYMAQTTYTYYTSNWYSTGVGATVGNFGNENLQWQKTRNYDLGMEIGFLNDRLLFMPRYYTKLTKGLVADVSLPPSTGFTSYKDNVGDMRNNGWELNFQYNVFRKQNFSLNVNLSLVHNTNTIVKISDALKAYNKQVDSAQTSAANMGAPLLRYNEGSSLDAIYAVRSLGIDPENGKELYVKKDGTLTYNWDVDDITAVGNTEAKAEGYFGTNIRYKQFSLNLSFYTRFGGQLYNQTLVDRVENANPQYNVDSRVFAEKWKAPGDHAFYKNIADLGTTQVSSRFVQKDNVLELQSLYFAYDADKSLYSKLGMKSLRFAFTMNDILRWASIKQERGTDYPYARSFTFSLTTNF
jgi:TonB-linked SusC/RagA family outer membrane protein